MAKNYYPDPDKANQLLHELFGTERIVHADYVKKKEKIWKKISRKNQRNKKQERRKAGLCAICGNPSPSFYLCIVCVNKRRKSEGKLPLEEQGVPTLRSGKPRHPCPVCGSTKVYRGWCDEHRPTNPKNKDTLYAEAKIYRNKKLGLCIQCSKPVCEDSTQYCDKHLDKISDYVQAHMHREACSIVDKAKNAAKNDKDSIFSDDFVERKFGLECGCEEKDKKKKPYQVTTG